MTDEPPSGIAWRRLAEYGEALRSLNATFAQLDRLCARVWREAQQTYSKRVIPQWADTVVAEDAERTRADAAEAQRDRLASALQDAWEAVIWMSAWIDPADMEEGDPAIKTWEHIRDQRMEAWRAALADVPVREE